MQRPPWLDDSLAPNGQAVKDNFARWFNGSCVVEPCGQPRVVYHGSALDPEADLLSFRCTHVPRVNYTGAVGRFQGVGTFFSESPMVASSFPALSLPQQSRRVYPVYLAIRNPKRYRTLTQVLKDFNEHHAGEPAAYIEALKAQGFDGLTFTEGPSWAGRKRALQACTWIPFRSEQVKSALSNSGLYVADHPSITDREAALALQASHRARRTISAAQRDVGCTLRKVSG